MTKTKTKTTTRRLHSPEFKSEAVKLVVEQGLTLAEAARDVGVHPTVLGRWVRGAQAASAPGALSSEERDELKRLRRENKVLRTEREIPRKAAAFFAKEGR